MPLKKTVNASVRAGHCPVSHAQNFLLAVECFAMVSQLRKLALIN